MSEDIFHAEAACITAVMANPDLDLDLTADDFVNEDCRKIWVASTKSRDLSVVTEILTKENNRDFLPVILEIYDEGFGQCNAPFYANRLREYALARKAQAIAKDLISALAGRDDKAIENAHRNLGSLLTTGRVSSHTLAQSGLAALQEIQDKLDGKVGVMTGLDSVDKALGGLHPSDLIVIGARPGVGKTAMMIQLALHNAFSNIPVGILSAEQGLSQIGQRALSNQRKATVSRMRSGDVDIEMLADAVESWKDVPCWINDTPCPTYETIAKQVKSWVREHGVRAVFVDYLQRLSGDKRLPKHERVGELARQLKTLAVETGIPIICLAQLNRAAEGGKPAMSNLKDSGEIEQEADQILLLHADDPDYSACRYPVELILEKNRHGPVAIWRLMWERSEMRYVQAPQGLR